MLVSSYHDPDEHDPNPLNIDYDEDPVYYNKATKIYNAIKVVEAYVNYIIL